MYVNRSGRLARRILASWIIFFLSATSPAAAQNSENLLNSTLQAQSRVDSASQQSQNTVEQLADQRNDLFADYRVATQQLDRLRIYNGNLERLVADQDAEKRAIATQLEEFGEVEKGIIPLMYEMIDALDTFVSLDIPFSRRERSDRVMRLRENMERSDFTVSEKYRQIMEAYQIETAYGRTIEAYSGSLPIDGEERSVELLRIGRILLAYQTPDQSQTGIWDKTTSSWIDVGEDYRRSISDGLSIAKKQAAPSLLRLPIPAAEVAE